MAKTSLGAGMASYARLSASAVDSHFRTLAIGEAESRPDISTARGRYGRWDSGIPGDHPTTRRAGEDNGLESGNDCFQLVIGLVPRHADLPAQTVVQRQSRFRAPAILCIDPKVPSARMQWLLKAQDFR